MEKKKVCIIIPAYNEEKRIGRTLNEYATFFQKNSYTETQILVVINNTKDQTEKVVKSFQKKFKIIKFLNIKQGGKGFAITEGFKYAIEKKFDLIGFIDADCSTPPTAFKDLLDSLGEYDGAIANRWDKKSVIPVKQPVLRQVISRVFNFLVRSLLLLNSHDTQCGAKLFKRRTLENSIKEMRVSEWAFDVNLLYTLKKNGFVLKDTPTYWKDEEGSKIKTIKASLQMFLSVLRLRVVYSPFEKLSKPLRPLVRAIYTLTK